MDDFLTRLERACQANRSLVCVGLDPEPERLPVDGVFEFNRAIIDATADLVCAYKPNLAFYEALGIPGLEALERTVDHVRSVAPDVVIIGDAKRGDIGPSAQAYAKAMFQVWGFDAITANAWGGRDSIEAFLEHRERGVFVWCRGSNPGAQEFQDLEVGGEPLFMKVARSCGEWNEHRNIGLVAGATVPGQLKQIREACAGVPLLIPGVGAQGGNLEAAVRAGVDSKGRSAIINSSRGIIYASGGPHFDVAARQAAVSLRDDINRVLTEDGNGWS